ncbi:MAG TPA: type ISP restriction/modification enzyme [Armatimonadota bacterium]|jgi:predicted helicase
MRININDLAFGTYYTALEDYRERGFTREQTVRLAFITLLETLSRKAGWTLALEHRLANGKIPDGTLFDEFRIPRGYWEAKDEDDDLETEIARKIALKYPTTNIVFEDSRRAVLYQNGKRVMEADLSQKHELAAALTLFFTWTEADIENFETAVVEFKDRIPDLAQGLMKQIEAERAGGNKQFTRAFGEFHDLCRSALNPTITAGAIEEMLVQHLLTERLFRTVFQNPDFTRRNVIASEIERVIGALTSRSFNRQDFLGKLDYFYVAIEEAARGLEGFGDKQGFLNTVYERFFQGFSVKQADTHGIVYTPQEIVDFMCASVDEVLKEEFGKSLSDEGVVILDPCVGTGNFIVNILNRIHGPDLARKYRDELFCNEIMLLPYYIASLNIEHAYYERTGEYAPFEGICFTDTLDLGKTQPTLDFSAANSARVLRQEQARVIVLIGNPPYNVGQQNENDNNKNRKYPGIEARIRETYVKESHATNTRALGDPYVKFFRWAKDRLQGRDGVVCFVSNNSFADEIAFDGMRAHMERDFTSIWHVDLHGNVRKNPKISGTSHNVFGIQVGVGITVAVKNSAAEGMRIRYHRVPEDWRRTEKLAYLAHAGDIRGVDWTDVTPDDHHTWRTEGLHDEFAAFPSMGDKAVKSGQDNTTNTLFRLYSRGAETTRDSWMYDFDARRLAEKAERMCGVYNAEVDRWRREGGKGVDVDNFVLSDERVIKWSSRLKECLTQGTYAGFEPGHVRRALYRPFTRQALYFDPVMTHRQGLWPRIYPNAASDDQNRSIGITDLGSEKPFMVMVFDRIADLHLVGAGASTQSFPFYTYDEDGTNRRENITDWALAEYRSRYGPDVTKWDIFHYLYGILHSPAYRETFAQNLKRELPRIPYVANADLFTAFRAAGAALCELHLDYESLEPWPLNKVDDKDVPFTWRVEKMALSKDKDAIQVNKSLRLTGVPEDCFRYRLGNRSALDWVIDQYQVKADKRTGIVSDPNRPDDPEYIVRLVGQVIRVSVETVKIVESLPAPTTL